MPAATPPGPSGSADTVLTSFGATQLVSAGALPGFSGPDPGYSDGEPEFAAALAVWSPVPQARTSTPAGA